MFKYMCIYIYIWMHIFTDVYSVCVHMYHVRKYIHMYIYDISIDIYIYIDVYIYMWRRSFANAPPRRGGVRKPSMPPRSSRDDEAPEMLATAGDGAYGEKAGPLQEGITKGSP